jgi:K+-transporting ATPase ATPase A chain
VVRVTDNAVIQLLLYVGVLVALSAPLGWFLANVFQGRAGLLERWLKPIERLLYRCAGVDPQRETGWKYYAIGLLLFNALGFLAVYALLRLQDYLPFIPQGFSGATPDLAFNTAASFTTNTNWQCYGGESTLGCLSQALGLCVQNFLSAATGIAVLAAFARGMVRRSTNFIGNFWVDVTRTTLYVLMPLSILLALILVSQGVVQNWKAYDTVPLLQPTKDAEGKPVAEQTLPMGPAASQVAIKQLGTNGGGFFNVNSAHPYENPTPLSNFLEMLAILLIPAACCHMYGGMVNDRRQGWALLAAMLVIFVPLAVGAIAAEQAGVPKINALGVDAAHDGSQSGGNMEGKETRFGIVNSSLWATATTAASNGSVNAMHDSFTPLGGLVPMWLMQLGEVVFGGVGSGLYGMLMFVLVGVFIAGLMVGRTPEYLGKKIEAYEMKMASLVILIPCIVVLVGTAIAVAGPGLEYNAQDTGEVKGDFNNPGAHGFGEVLYAFSSAGNNNGSAFGGLTANEPFYNMALGLAMLIARYWLIIPVLAVAGSLARKKYTPPSLGTLPTHTPLFVALLVGTVLLVGALTFLPALALGPIVEHLQMVNQ